MRVAEVRAAEVRAAEVRAAEVRAAEVRAAFNRPFNCQANLDALKSILITIDLRGELNLAAETIGDVEGDGHWLLPLFVGHNSHKPNVLSYHVSVIAVVY